MARAVLLALLGGGQLVFLFWLVGFLCRETRAAGEPLNVWLAGGLFFGLLSYLVIWLGFLYMERDGREE